jgi:hypothetical protein
MAGFFGVGRVADGDGDIALRMNLLWQHSNLISGYIRMPRTFPLSTPYHGLRACEPNDTGYVRAC